MLVRRSAVLDTWQNRKRKAEPSEEVESAKRWAPSSKSENDTQWMTLVDAEEHIEILQKCNSFEALQELKEEIGDGIVAVKWANDPTDNPDVTILKTSEFILTGPGFAPDGKEYRPLLANRADVQRLWPDPSDLVKEMPGEESDSKTRRGRPSERDQIWAALSEMKIQELLPPSGNQKIISEDVAKKCNQKIGSRGWSHRTVLQHISDWQKENPPADPKTRK